MITPNYFRNQKEHIEMNESKGSWKHITMNFWFLAKVLSS